MGRGRKPMVSNLNDWQSVFYNSVGSYVQLINLELAKTIDSEPLSKHIRIAGGFAFKSSSYVSEGIPVIRISNFNDEKIILDNVKFYKESDDLKKYELNPGDIVIALTGGTIAKLGIVQEGIGKLYLNQRVGKFEVLNPAEFEAEYVYWIARSVQSIIKELAWGAAIPNVSPKDIEKLKFPIPDRKTQKGIISFLNDLKNNSLEEKSYFNGEIEEKIVSTHQNQVDGGALSTELTHQLDLVKQLRQAFLREAMQGKLIVNGELSMVNETDEKLTTNHSQLTIKEEPASVLLEKIKAEKERLIKEKKIKRQKPLPPITEEDIPFEIPENWVWCRLKDIVEITGGGTPSKGRSDYWNGDIPWISPKDMKSLTVSDSELKVTEKGVKNSSTKMIPEGSLLVVGRSGILKRTIPVAINEVACTVNQDMKVLIPFLKNMNRFIQNMLFGIEEILLKEYVKFGMTVHSLKYSEFELMPIPLPPLSEQQRIVAKLDELMQYCDELETSIKESQQQNELLLQQVLREALEPKEKEVTG